MSLIDELDYRPRQANAVQRATWKLSASRPGAWLFAKTLHHIDRQLMRVSSGRLSVPGIVAGLPVITLVTTGAKSGVHRESPLVGVPVGDELAVIGTHFGQRATPSWWFNLKAHPDATVIYRERTVAVTAREATAEEGSAVWERARAVYAGYEAYARRITHRPVHIALLRAA